MKSFKSLISIYSIMILTFALSVEAKDISMRQGYRQLKLSTFPKDRGGSLIAFLYSSSSSSSNSYIKSFDRNQTLMVKAITDSLKTGHISVANSIWRRLIKSFNNSSNPIDLNNLIFSLINQSYLEKHPRLTYRANLFHILENKVLTLEKEKERFKQVLKECKDHSHCDYNTENEILKTNELWKRRTDIFEKEMKRAQKKFKEAYDEEDSRSRVILHVGTLFFESAETIVSEED